MNDDLLRTWDIWHARFNFDDGIGYKYRPVIILNNPARGPRSMMVTSATNKLSLPHDYLIKDWSEAGLDRPSIARADRIAKLPMEYLGLAGRIGRLSERDISSLVKVLQQLDEPWDAVG